MATEQRLSSAPTRIPAAAIGLSSAAAVLALIYYWFGVVDRYVVFLYGHVDGPGDTPALPFDAVTRSRYWMSGLVAAGVVSVAYVALMIVAGTLARRRGRQLEPAPWWRAWLWSAGPLAVGVPWITMTQNQPTLPPDAALAVTGAALAALALALLPGSLAAVAPRELSWLAAYGLALLPTLALWRAIELPARGILDPPMAWTIALVSVLLSAVLLALLRGWRHRRQRRDLHAGAVLMAGIWWLALFAPLAHHVVFAPKIYRYITSAENVLGFHPVTPLTALALAGLLAWLATRPPRRVAS